MANGIPEGITRAHILEAIEAIDSGLPHDFADSTGYDLVHRGKAYPPKAIIGVAARFLTGNQLGPYDFKGGVNSKCFKILEENGFQITSKRTVADTNDHQKNHKWSDEELEASVRAYLDMLDKDFRGERVNKSIYYKELAHAHSRTAKAFEFRMTVSP